MNTYTNDTHKIIKLVQINQMEQYFIKFTTAGKVGGNDGKSTITRRTKKKGASSRMSDGMDIQYRFNALRFLAMNLKSQNETMKPRTAQGGESPHSSTGIGGMKGGATF